MDERDNHNPFDLRRDRIGKMERNVFRHYTYEREIEKVDKHLFEYSWLSEFGQFGAVEVGRLWV